MSENLNEALGISESKQKQSSVQSQKHGGFFSFRTLISPQIIKFVHVLGLIALFIVAINFMTYGDEYIIYGILIIIFGPFVWRILCEGWILAFSIHEILASIEKKLEK